MKSITESLNVIAGSNMNRGGEFVRTRGRAAVFIDWFHDERMNGVCNHTTRGHIAPDLHRYLFVSAYTAINGVSPKLHDFPESLLPKHKNAKSGAFCDRFRAQGYEGQATTVTCHISKDGHYFIHPDPTQCRSLTVREAARIQTFPDNYFFCGPRTSQYTQVGNAVPPLLARRIADSLSSLFD
ncbi:DNA cytosine methyltransferase [Maridesulfovibrio sp.]|uniref:DNA cytosine methyltransferase n=1 Tax=Maridesulfovibrio sp. TaxID=2795000 RepID=UPI0039EEDE16